MIVYRHRRLDTNEIFYVGIGKTEKRAYSKRSRNSLWYNIVDKTDYSVEIIAEVDTWELACELEELLIQEYGRRDLGLGSLVNMTDGGEGRTNVVVSDETRKKMSKTRTGKKFSEETKTKISEAMKGKKHLEETKRKISNNSRGHKKPDRSLEHNQKLSEALKGRLAPNRKKVICTITGFIWDSIKECANHNNINYGTLKDKLNGRLKNNTNFIIYG